MGKKSQLPSSEITLSCRTDRQTDSPLLVPPAPPVFCAPSQQREPEFINKSRSRRWLLSRWYQTPGRILAAGGRQQKEYGSSNDVESRAVFSTREASKWSAKMPCKDLCSWDTATTSRNGWPAAASRHAHCMGTFCINRCSRSTLWWMN